MPKKPKRPCSFPNCPNLCDKQYCSEHSSKVNYQYNHYMRDPESNKRYGSQWRKIRARYVKLHPLCEECQKHGKLVPVEEVHHIVPLSEGGSNDLSNLMSLCKSCHSAVTLASNNKNKSNR